MQGLALVDFDNFREPDKKSKVDLEMDAQRLVDRVARTFAKVFSNAREVDVRLYGGWTDRTGMPSRDAAWLHELLPDLRGRRHGLIIRPALATTMIRFPDFLLRGTVRYRSRPKPQKTTKRQKMVDGMMGCDALHMAVDAWTYISIVTDDDDLLPATLYAHNSNVGLLAWMRNRDVGSAINDSAMLLKGLPLHQLEV